MLSTSFILLLAALSLSVWARIGRRWSQGQPALESLPRVPSPWLPIACGAAGILVAMMLAISLHSLFGKSPSTPTITLRDVQWSVLDGVLHIVVAVVLLTGAGKVPLHECGMSSAGLPRQIRDGLLGYLASLAPVMLMLALTYSLRSAETQHPFLQLLQRDPSSMGVAAWLLLTAVVVAPIKEELIFRVMLQDGLARRIGSTPAIAITSVLFCLVHGFPDSIALLPLAVILGYVYDRRQSVVSVVLIHALFNLTNIATLLIDPQAPT